MLDIGTLRAREEQKVVAALHSLNAARKELQVAIGATEAQEREFRRISDEARRRLEALDIVEQMTKEHEAPATAMIAPPEETSEALSKLAAATGSTSIERVSRVTRASSPQFFSPFRRTKATELSILP